MSSRIAITSRGLWRLRPQLRAAFELEPVFWDVFFRRSNFDPTSFELVGGWGLKRTTARARSLAVASQATYISFEDGWLRSVNPGPAEPPLSIVADRTGIYCDATRPSDLEAMITTAARGLPRHVLDRARAGITYLTANRLSKYNHAPDVARAELGFSAHSSRRRVLVVDQTYGDGSITYGLASDQSFSDMLAAALVENPDAEILVKTHPEVQSRRKRGYLTRAKGSRITLIDRPVNPWALIEQVEKVYVVTSQLGFEALLGGREVICFGAPFYSGWGLTEDRVSVPRRTAKPSLEQLFAALYFEYARYVRPDTGRATTFEDAAEWLLDQREKRWRKSTGGFAKTLHAGRRFSTTPLAANAAVG